MTATPIPVARPWLPDVGDYSAIVADIFERRFVSNFSKYTELLEQRAAEALGHDVLAVASADIGMTLAWRALGHGSGEVIVPSFTFASTVNALVWNGLTPVFADIDPETLCVDPSSVESLITPATVGIAAVHVFGEPVSTDIDRIARDAGVSLLFDAAQAVGTTEDGRSVAGRGDAAVFSLSGTKVVTAGEGGLAAFADSVVSERFRELRGYGFIGDYNVQETGLNGKMSELDAGLGYLSFAMMEHLVARREEIAARYRARLEGRHGISMQPAAPLGDRRSYKDLVVMFPDATSRERVESALTSSQVGTKRYFFPMHTTKAYGPLARRNPLVQTEDIWSRALCLPIYHDLTDTQIDFISDRVLDALSDRSR